jgi:DNA-binding CsgD family transcriptional regulator
VPPPPSLDLESIRRRFDLAPAQARLTALICNGHPLREAAARLGITEGSARQYLRRIFDKTGVRRQADLIRLVGPSSYAE